MFDGCGDLNRGYCLDQALSSSGGKKKCKKCGGDLKDLPANKVAQLPADPCTLMEQVRRIRSFASFAEIG
jgi:hypothetical protein